MKVFCAKLILASIVLATNSDAFTIPSFSTVVANGVKEGIDAELIKNFDPSAKTIAVTGATGRTGSLVVKELLNRGKNVIAIVRDEQKAADVLPVKFPPTAEKKNLIIKKCDLASEDNVVSTIQASGCDASIWCATGFSDNESQSFLDKLGAIFGVAVQPKKSIDAVGVPALAKAFEGSEDTDGPKVVMLSSAGVTRPSWSDEKKEQYKGCADIPIVRLNPFNILNIKADSEERLRESGTPYCIFRPTGLNEDWPVGSRPIFSQGDVAVGRINRKDVAKILVDCVFTKESVGKTFEAFSIEGYPPAEDISMALGRLRLDSEGPMSEDALAASYSAMQQLLPGEKQDPSQLAMGQTYEQLDKGETGRLGEKGEENAEAAAPKPTTV